MHQMKNLIQSEYFFDNKPRDVEKNVPKIDFDKVTGRKRNDESYQTCDGTYDSLFP